MANLEENLKKYLQEIAKNEKYLNNKIDIKAISSEGANYTTILFLATISEPLKSDLNLFAKVANLNEELRSKNAIISNVYVIEGIFYTELSENFESIYNKNNVPAEDRILKPKYYGHVLTPLEETLVLENLEAKGFKNFDRMKTFNWDYASTAITQLARFHAIGLAFQHENPMEFEEITKKLEMNYLNDNQMETFMQQAVQNGLEAVNGEYKSRLETYLNVQQMKELMSLFLMKPTMLIHGDFRPSNLMHRRRGGKLEIVTLDYQTIRMGNPVADLMYFIFSGSDEEFRRLHYQRLLDHYFTQLTLALRQLNMDVEEVYPKKTFELDLIELQPLGLLISLAMLALFMVDPEDAPKIEGDMDSFQVKPNQRALERINSVVRDFAKWGVI